MKNQCQCKTSKNKQCKNTPSTKAENNQQLCWLHQKIALERIIIEDLSTKSLIPFKKNPIPFKKSTIQLKNRTIKKKLSEYIIETYDSPVVYFDFLNLVHSNTKDNPGHEYNYNSIHFSLVDMEIQSQEKCLNEVIFANSKVNFIFPNIISAKSKQHSSTFDLNESEIVSIGNTLEDLIKAIIDWLIKLSNKLGDRFYDISWIEFQGLDSVTHRENGEVLYQLTFDRYYNSQVYTGEYSIE